MIGLINNYLYCLLFYLTGVASL